MEFSTAFSPAAAGNGRPAAAPAGTNPTGLWEAGRFNAAIANQWQATIGVTMNQFVAGGSTVLLGTSNGCPVFDIPTTQVLLATPFAFTTWATTSEHSFLALIDFTSIPGDGLISSNQAGNKSMLIADPGGIVAMAVWREGGSGTVPDPYRYWLGHWDRQTPGGAANNKRAFIEITSLLNPSGGGRLLALGRKRAGFLEVKANTLPWTVGDACGVTTTGIGSGVVGVWSPAAPADALGTARFLATWNRAITDAEGDAFVAWAPTV